MQRRKFLVLYAVLTGCTSTKSTLTNVMPASLPGGWTRGEVSPLQDVPPVISSLRPEESVQTRYRSDRGEVAVRAFRMPAETSAFEVIQKWRQTDGLAAYKGPYLFIANGDGSTDILRELQKAISQ